MGGFRTFRNEPTYEAPDVNSVLANTMGTVHQIIRENALDKKARRTAAERFKLDNVKGYYATDRDALDESAKQITSQAIHEIGKNGHVSAETALMMEDRKGLADRSRIDYETAKGIRGQVKEMALRDKYYNGDVDNDKIIKAEYDGTISDRNDRLQAVAGQLKGIDTFNKSRFLADYIQRQKLNTMQSVSEKSGVKNTKMTSAIFMKPDGTPGVTDDHVIDYFNSDPRLDEHYTMQVDRQLGNEVKRMRGLGDDERVSWMKGMDDEDVKAALIENPSLNIVNGTPLGQRKKDLAKSDLSAGQDINRKTAVDYSDQYGANGGKFSNTKIGYQPTKISQAINFKTLNGAKNVGTVGADLTYIDKAGPIKFTTNTPVRANVGTGEVDTKASDNLEFNLTNYGLYIYDDKGQLMPIQGDNLEDMKKSIDAIPDQYFKKDSNHPLSPQMSVGLNGYAVNKTRLINQSLEKAGTLAEEYNKAVDSGDDIKAAQLQKRMGEIDKIRSMAGNGDVDDLQLMIAGKQLGISGIQNDYIIKASDQDMSKLRSITNGLDLRDQSKWTDDMRELNDHYVNRYNKAQEDNKNQKKTSIPKLIRSDGSDTDKWKSGNEYLYNGSTYYYDKTAGQWKKK